MIICPCSITPHDWTLTLVSVCVIFICLVILFIVYSIMGKVNTKGVKLVKEAASGKKGQSEAEEGIHDFESGIITIESAGPRSGARTTSRTIAASTFSSSSAAEGIVRSPLPGVVLKMLVREGQKVKKGEKIAVIEAMKMENDILCESGGTIIEVKVAAGDSVLEGSEIAKIG